MTRPPDEIELDAIRFFDLEDAQRRIAELEAKRVTISANILGIADALDVGPHDKHSAKSCSDSMRGIANELSTSSKK